MKTLSIRAIPALFRVLVFFTPLVFAANTFELFEFPKMYFVYIAGITIIWLFLITRIGGDKKVLWPGKVILLFLLIYIVSTVLSSHPYTSMWGYYKRFNGGLASVLVFVGLYIVAKNEFNRQQLKHLAEVACLSLIPVSLYAIFQHYGIITNIWGANVMERVTSTFGQPNWLAAYVVMLIPIILYRVLEAKNRVFWIILYSLAFVTLWLTYSLSGILGFVAGTAAFGYLNRARLKTAIVPFAVLAAFSISFAFLNPGIFKGKLQDVFFDLKRIVQTHVQVYAQTESEQTEQEYNVSDPGFIRFELWKGTVNLITSSTKTMLIGTGPETFPYEFTKFRSPEINYSSEWNFVINKPHNYYLELLSTIGFIGTFFYLLIISRSILRKDKFFTPGLLALYATNIFGWPVVAPSLLFWLFLAGTEAKE